ncbi:MAG: alpha-glucosidase C-terminal domain-containing protein, partial [Elusimicrobiota bacterium]
AVQFTLPGSPMIWYGDEAGMWGSDDPFDRKPMIWREQQPYDDKDSTFMDDIYNHYRTLARIKTSYPQLKEGSFSNVLVDDKNKVYAFSMTRKNKIAIVAVNNSNKSAGATITAPLADNTELTEMLSENKIYKVRNGSIKLTLPPKTAKILVQK